MNATENITQYHAWKAEPQSRGTFSILSTCILTLVLCVWKAIHVNIPEYGKTADLFWRKAGWVMMALFTPELVVFQAYCHNKEAMELGDYMRKQLNQDPPPNIIRRAYQQLQDAIRYILSKVRHQKTVLDNKRPSTHLWTDTHSFFAVMGGFVIDTGDRESYLPRGETRLVLSVPSIKFIAKHVPKFFERVSESYILDKSKGNPMVKILACSQAAWFCIQCLTRHSQGLTVSLLELNVGIHSAGALMHHVFTMWSKPLDVEEGFVLQGKDIELLGAFLAAADSLPGSDLSRLSLEREDAADSQQYLLQLASEAARTFDLMPLPQSGGRKKVTFYDALIHADVGFNPVQAKRHILSRRIKARPTSEQLKLKLRDEFSGPDRAWKLVLTHRLVFANLCYGGAHMLVWNHVFRTATEELLWRISATTISVFGLLSIPVYLMGEAAVDWASNSPPEGKELHNVVVRIGMTCRCILLRPELAWSLHTTVWLFYIFCRVFIIVECFLDVFHLPESAFDTPEWSHYFPHFA